MASGLTCSMCNLATQKQLQSLNFVDSIVPDLELNAFHIYFTANKEIDFGMIKKKVEDAGFFVAELKVTYQNTEAFTLHKPLLFFGKSALFIEHFNDQKQIHIFKFIDEGFLTSKELKKYKKVKQGMVLSSNSSDVHLLTGKMIYYVVEE